MTFYKLQNIYIKKYKTNLKCAVIYIVTIWSSKIRDLRAINKY